MGTPNVNANAIFMPAWNNAVRKVRKTTEDEQQNAMDAFRKAMVSCDKAMEDVVDRHQQTVAESAKKRAEYHKRKALQDRRIQAAEEQRLLNEQIAIQRINHRNMQEEMRIDDINRRELIKARTK